MANIDSPQYFSNKVKDTIDKHGINQAELAKFSNKSITTINKLYNQLIPGNASTQGAIVTGLNKALKELEVETRYTTKEIFPHGPGSAALTKL